jgi:predicted short-subunit dehydrogenase-like oxidoreductase (DUF2520 family)
MDVGTKKCRANRARIACMNCGGVTPWGSGEHDRTTCSAKCLSELAAKRARLLVDTHVMPIWDVEKYLDLLDMADDSIAWKAKQLRAQAKAMLE